MHAILMAQLTILTQHKSIPYCRCVLSKKKIARLSVKVMVEPIN